MELNMEKDKGSALQATVHDLPGWNVVDTVQQMLDNHGMSAWAYIGKGALHSTRTLVRDRAGRLYLKNAAEFLPRTPDPRDVLGGWVAYVVSEADGIAVWVSRASYPYIALEDDPSGHSFAAAVSRVRGDYVPVRRVLPEKPEDA
jgi:hypothetical protein